MINPIGDAKKDDLRFGFDSWVKLKFLGSQLTTDAGLLAYRVIDETLGLTEAYADCWPILAKEATSSTNSCRFCASRSLALWPEEDGVRPIIQTVRSLRIRLCKRLDWRWNSDVLPISWPMWNVRFFTILHIEGGPRAMPRKRFTEEQIAFVLRQHEGCGAVRYEHLSSTRSGRRPVELLIAAVRWRRTIVKAFEPVEGDLAA